MKRLFFLFVFSFTVSYAQTAFYDTIQVNTGWNLIGPLDNGAVVNTISTIPPAIIISPFFQYSGQYLASDTLTRGKGYWVKVSEQGIIILQIIGDPCDSILTVYHQGKTYNTIAMGRQCWLRENLNVGVMIDSIQNATNNGIIEKYCYRNDTVNCIKYGGLYQWNEVMQYTTTSGTQGICPAGWHIPTFGEFWTLIYTVNFSGNTLKSVGQGSGSGAGTNTSSFSALLAGYRTESIWFYDLGVYGSYWSSTESSLAAAHNLGLLRSSNTIHRPDNGKENGFSIRCIKDEN